MTAIINPYFYTDLHLHAYVCHVNLRCLALCCRQYAKRVVDMGYTEVKACFGVDTAVTNQK